jgi:hypothetical protein
MQNDESQQFFLKDNNYFNNLLMHMSAKMILTPTIFITAIMYVIIHLPELVLHFLLLELMSYSCLY